MLTAKRVEREKRPGRYRDGHIRGLYLQVGPTGGKILAAALRARRPRALARVGATGRRRFENSTRARPCRPPAPARRHRSDRSPQSREGQIGRRQGQAADLSRGRAGVLRSARRQVEERQARATKSSPRCGSMPSRCSATWRWPISACRKCCARSSRIWTSKTETASRVRGRIESVLDWCTVRGYRTGDNPARWKGHLSEVLPARGQIKKTNHHPALPYRDIPAFMADLRKREGVAVRALEFAILTVARTGEVIGARWDEISLEEKTWTIPAGRMKGGKEHRVPLSERAVELLRALPREDGNDFVFIGARTGAGLGPMALVQVLKCTHPDFTVHGLRSCFKDWASETTNFPNFVVEQAMAHAIPSAVEAAYRRGDLLAKRRQLAEAWSKYCTSPLPAGAVVVPMRKGAQA